MVDEAISDSRQKQQWKEKIDRVFCLFHIPTENGNTAETEQQKEKREPVCKHQQAFALRSKKRNMGLDV